MRPGESAFTVKTLNDQLAKLKAKFALDLKIRNELQSNLECMKGLMGRTETDNDVIKSLREELKDMNTAIRLDCAMIESVEKQIRMFVPSVLEDVSMDFFCAVSSFFPFFLHDSFYYLAPVFWYYVLFRMIQKISKSFVFFLKFFWRTDGVPFCEIFSLSSQKENFQKNSRISRVGTSLETLFHCKVTKPLRNGVFHFVIVSKLYFNKFRILELFKILRPPGIPQKYLVLLLNVQCGQEGLIKGS